MQQYRCKANLTQSVLAARSGVSTDTISKLETGGRTNAHAMTVARLAEALGIEPSLLEGASPGDDARGSGEDGGGGGWRDRLRRRRMSLEVTEAEGAELSRLVRHTLNDLLPEDTPQEAFVKLEWMWCAWQGQEYKEAESKAYARIYGPGDDPRG